MVEIRQVEIIDRILTHKLIEHKLFGACMYVVMLFSEQLKKRNITHTLVRGYMNDDFGDIKISYVHYWISVDATQEANANDKIYDPTVMASGVLKARLEKKIAKREHTMEPRFPLESNDESDMERSGGYTTDKIISVFLRNQNIAWAMVFGMVEPTKETIEFIVDVRETLK